MILPSGNSKKYIKVVIGIYVLFTIISPVITKLTGETIDVSDILDLDKYVEEAEDVVMQNTIQSNNQIMQVYSSGIKDDMKAKIEAKGYMVNSIDIGIANDESYSITDITIDVEKETENEENTGEADTNKVEPIESVNKVEISITGDSTKADMNSNENNLESNNSSDNSNDLSNSEKKKLKEYISSVYEVNEDNIIID